MCPIRMLSTVLSMFISERGCVCLCSMCVTLKWGEVYVSPVVAGGNAAALFQPVQVWVPVWWHAWRKKENTCTDGKSKANAVFSPSIKQSVLFQMHHSVGQGDTFSVFLSVSKRSFSCQDIKTENKSRFFQLWNSRKFWCINPWQKTLKIF